MNNFLTFISRSSHAQRLIGFNIIFFGGMWASKTIHPLWFQASNSSLSFFGWSYSAMAVAGSLSFFVGYLADRYGITRALRIGLVLYAVGMALRCYTHSLTLAIVSGVIAGLGASTVLVCIRPLIFSWVTEKEIPLALALKNSTISIGSSAGTLLAGWIPTILTPSSISYPAILLGSACSPILAALLIPEEGLESAKVESSTQVESKVSIREIFHRHSFLAIAIVFFGILSGGSASLLNPYLPVILADFGFDIGSIGILLATSRLTAAIVSLSLGKVPFEKIKYQIFLISGICLSIITLVLASSPNQLFCGLFVLIYGIIFAVSVLTEEIIQMAIYPRNLMAFCFGLTQTGFLIGDSVGGVLGGWIYDYIGFSPALLIFSGLIIARSIFFPLVAFKLEKSHG
jgi:MFS family permease